MFFRMQLTQAADELVSTSFGGTKNEKLLFEAKYSVEDVSSFSESRRDSFGLFTYAC